MTKSSIRKTLIAIGIAVLFALAMRFLFGAHAWDGFLGIMTISFLVLIPFGVGALTIVFSDIEKVKSKAYTFFVPWIPILAFFLITLAFAIEGWACWLMVLPIFLIASSIGGSIAAYYKKRKHHKNDTLLVSAVVILPLLMSPIERNIELLPSKFEAYTSVDIHAPKAKIWSNVTVVERIEQAEDTGWLTQFLGFPRPIEAKLDFEGIGAKREAIFDKGLVFHEEVLDYEHQQKMYFSIKAYPHEIPSTTMDEHIVIGGDYFDVLDGTYQLEQLGKDHYRLHLFSHFKLSTTFNGYAGWWAKWIMTDIQNNILLVIKNRSEKTG